MTMDDPSPVYAEDLTTIVGHNYPYPYSFTSVGQDPATSLIEPSAAPTTPVF
jgi:hypothetical protein